jgi:hypothetical protein
MIMYYGAAFTKIWSAYVKKAYQAIAVCGVLHLYEASGKKCRVIDLGRRQTIPTQVYRIYSRYKFIDMRALVSCHFFICGCELTLQMRRTTDLFKPAYIKSKMIAVAGWQLNHSNKKPETDWTHGAFYTGVFAAYKTTKSKPSLLDSLFAIGERKNWQAGKRFDHADDYAITQTYVDLYRVKKDPAIIRASVDSIQKMRVSGGQRSTQARYYLVVVRCAFYGAAGTGQTSKNVKRPILPGIERYFVQAVLPIVIQQRRAPVCTRCQLPDRHTAGNGKKEANGKKIFWSRGNGWVIAGLARLLEEMPKNYAGRDFYVTLYKEMAERLLLLQQTGWFVENKFVRSRILCRGRGEWFRVSLLCIGLGHQSKNIG